MRRDVGVPCEAGFSMIEVLIAAAMLLIVALGVLPLFTQAMVNNTAGAESTRVANHARTRAEEFLQYPFNSASLLVPAGVTEREIDDYYAREEEAWFAGTVSDAASAGHDPLFTRTTTIRQFNVQDLTTPLDGGAPPGAVHVKEITVEIEGTRSAGPLGAGKRIAVRVHKSQ